MANVKVKALKPVVLRDASTGALTSIACGQFAEIDSELASALITDGLVASGLKTITDTDVTDVTGYTAAQVVDSNLVATNIKKDVEILGVTGTYTG